MYYWNLSSTLMCLIYTVFNFRSNTVIYIQQLYSLLRSKIIQASPNHCDSAIFKRFHILNPDLYYLLWGDLLGQSNASQYVIKTCTLSMSMDFVIQSFSNLATFLALLAGALLRKIPVQYCCGLIQTLLETIERLPRA